jgi:hypothetical protein
MAAGQPRAARLGIRRWRKAQDSDRVYVAPDKYLNRGDNTYVGVLSAAARITGGRFSPEHALEQWDGERGPIRVRFAMSNRNYEWTTDEAKYFDVAIVHVINQCIDGARRTLRA